MIIKMHAKMLITMNSVSILYLFSLCVGVYWNPRKLGRLWMKETAFRGYICIYNACFRWQGGSNIYRSTKIRTVKKGRQRERDGWVGIVKSNACGKWDWGIVVVSAWARIPSHQCVIIAFSLILICMELCRPFPSLLNTWLLRIVTLLPYVHDHFIAFAMFERCAS